MSSQQLQFYEQKIISDKEFPIEVFMNRVQDKCQYFHTHWHEHIELHYVVHGETDILLNQTRYTFRHIRRNASTLARSTSLLHLVVVQVVPCTQITWQQARLLTV